jgi:hypothetical protein
MDLTRHQFHKVVLRIINIEISTVLKAVLRRHQVMDNIINNVVSTTLVTT